MQTTYSPPLPVRSSSNSDVFETRSLPFIFGQPRIASTKLAKKHPSLFRQSDPGIGFPAFAALYFDAVDATLSFPGNDILVKYGKKGVTSNGIFSLGEVKATGFDLANST